MNIQTLSKECKDFLQRILESSITDERIPKDRIGEEKEYKWRASSINHEPILINNASGKMVAGVGTEARAQSSQNNKSNIRNIVIKPTSVPSVNSGETPKIKKFFDTYVKQMNGLIQDGKVSDETVANLFSEAVPKLHVEKLVLALTDKGHITQWAQRNNPRVSLDELKVSDLNKHSHMIGTALHELGHCLDMAAGEPYRKERIVALDQAAQKPLPKEIKDNIDKLVAQLKAQRQEIVDRWSPQITEIVNKVNHTTDISEYYKYKKQYMALRKERNKELETAKINMRKECDGYDAISDICDAVYKGRLYKDGAWGHGAYFNSDRMRALELWADYSHLAMKHPDKLQILEKYYPELVKVCQETAKVLEGEWKK